MKEKPEKKDLKKSAKENKKTGKKLTLKEGTRHGIFAVISFAFGLLLMLSIWGGAGAAGRGLHEFLSYMFGVGYFLLPVVCFLLGISFIKSGEPNIGAIHTVSGIVLTGSTLGFLDIIFSGHQGGIIGQASAYPFVKLFDVYAGSIVLVALLLISLLVMFDAKPDVVVWFEKFKNLFTQDKKQKKEKEEEATEPAEDEWWNDEDEIAKADGDTEEVEAKEEAEENTEEKTAEVKGDEEEIVPKKKKKRNSSYVPPPLSLLEEDKGKANVGDVKANLNIIKRTLENFGIQVEMDEVTIGPSVTRYALKPAQGMKLSKILALQSDLALALAAHPIRIEAPIPGKSLVGIEIPNKTKSTVGLATLLADEKFAGSQKALTVALGRGISGKPMFGNIAKMPHLLIAGTTGSGKSVTIHSIITSLLYRNSPDELSLIMIDPKRVELTLYNGIPHLLTPVITDAKKAILALKWAAKEMDRRYDIFERESVRDIESYQSGKREEELGYIVILIDELADIMSAYPRELESAIVRLAQMSRAVGIHLILSTQRPEVNVITGLIKANVPARIALKVSSQIDSRTILDAGGAEKLLGQGDMLWSSGESAPERLQSAFISENEVKKVVNYLKDSFKDEVRDDINISNESINREKSIFESVIDDEASGDDDELYEEAREIVMSAGKASTSYLQRKLKVGYARAARLIDMLEERGVVSAGEGAKAREVIGATNTEGFGQAEEDSL